MRHYNLTEWQDYIDNNLTDEVRDKMEEHILSCDRCLELYLSTLENEASKKEITVSSNFTDSVMTKIYKEEKSIKRNKRYISDFFIYYAAAACITIFFTARGVFSSYQSNVLKITEGFIEPVNKMEQVFMNGWTDRILNENSNLKDYKGK